MTRLDEERARQGRRGTPILMILIAALALCAIVFVGVQFYGASEPDASLDDGSKTATDTAPAKTDANNGKDVVVAPDNGGTTGTGTGSQ
ncbi:hypothetical protein [Jiella sonneratiae]|uniref:Uncharacterized protein n=1 Tax=Jiella sonneratiae TaxID=2816856 RepID=A0ABS3J8F5_9HYPH|nr:hypothetical protein [Jiella sonneratiae]MBO0904856.1 hypothetical protein [Jiella sonneratiae]